jgi:hypothetical protein
LLANRQRRVSQGLPCKKPEETRRGKPSDAKRHDFRPRMRSLRSSSG